MMFFLFLILTLILLLLLSALTERFIILTRRQKIYLENLPSSFNGLKILQISDIHHRTFGKDQMRIVKRAKREKPDVIVITGDLISRDMRDFASVGRFCRELSRISTVLFSIGNHELDLPEKVQTTYLQTLKNSGVKLLLNSDFTLNNNGQVLRFVGVSLDLCVYHGDGFSYNSLYDYSLQDVQKDIGVRSGCTVLLSHNPFVFPALSLWNADLVLSGHVHGGVVRLPFIGGLLSPERKFFPVYSKGLYKLNSSQLYVSAGLGKFRLFNPPEINLITLISDN